MECDLRRRDEAGRDVSLSLRHTSTRLVTKGIPREFPGQILINAVTGHLAITGLPDN
jgi:hypothetical protein